MAKYNNVIIKHVKWVRNWPAGDSTQIKRFLDIML